MDAVEEVLERLKQQSFYWRGKQATKEELSRLPNGSRQASKSLKPLSTVEEERAELERALQASGFKDKVKAFAFHWLREQAVQAVRAVARRGSPESSPAVEWARRQWAELQLQQLRKLSKEQRQPFLRRRPKARHTSKDPKSEDEVSTRHIVDLKSLFYLITRDLPTRQARESSRGPSSGQSLSGKGSVKLEDLQQRYAELSPSLGHLGVPEVLPDLAASRVGRGTKVNHLETTRRSLGQELLVRSYPGELQIFCRFGVPASLRREIWFKCFDCVGDAAEQALQEAARGICEWEWLTDDVLRLDVAEHCANDVSYFPFDELVEALVLALSRDRRVSELCESGPPQIPIVTDVAPETLTAGADLCAAHVEVGGAASTSSSIPPSGVVPFKGFSNYACPFAFLADRLETAYPIFRAFYCRHLCRLHSISDHPNTLLSLCRTFEDLVKLAAPRAAHHVFTLDASPLRYAFHWIVTAFAGCLPAEQVLQLWDRILGFDSVELVPVLAAAVFAFRARLVLAARRPEEVQLLFADISCIKAIPLLQAFLFASELGIQWEP